MVDIHMELVMKFEPWFSNWKPNVFAIQPFNLMGKKCGGHWIYYVVYSKCFTKVNFSHFFPPTLSKWKNKLNFSFLDFSKTYKFITFWRIKYQAIWKYIWISLFNTSQQWHFEDFFSHNIICKLSLFKINIEFFYQLFYW